MITKIYIGLFCLLAIFIALTIFSLVGLTAILQNTIQDGALMTDKNVDLWSESPGKTKSPTMRNYSFLNFTNPKAYFYRGQKPIFRQIGGYLYEEKTKMLNITFSEDKSEINTNFWLYFVQDEHSRNTLEEVNVVNFVMLGYWSKLDQVPLATFALQGFGNLFLELNRTFKTQAIGQGIQTKYLVDEASWQIYCNDLQLSFGKCSLLWSDRYYGLNNPNNYLIWTQFSHQNNSGAATQLQEYFGFQRKQMRKLKVLFQNWSKTIEEILNNWYCNSENCSNYDFAMIQLGTSEITNNPPSGPSVQSICLKGNITCLGFPQISTFLKVKFPEIDSDKKYQALKFTRQTMMELFRPYHGTFLNIGNLTELFEVGDAYDFAKSIGQSSQATALLLQFQILSHTDTLDHAYVLWEYAKYFANQFVIHTSNQGNRKITAMSGTFNDKLYKAVTKFKNWVLPELLSLVAAQQIKNCSQFIKATVNNISGLKASSVCRDVSENDYKSYWKLLEPCSIEISEEYQLYRMRHDLTIAEMEELCDQEELSVYQVLKSAHKKISTHYQCKLISWEDRCTAQELTIKQFINSTITSRPILPELNLYNSALSASFWDSSLDEFQYKHFLKEAYEDQGIDQQIHSNYSSIQDLLSFDKLFSTPMTIKMLTTNDSTIFQTNFYWKNSTFLKDYVRYIVTEVGFGGFTLKRPVRELLFGFSHPFLQEIKQKNTMLGGDPTLNTILMLCDPNTTEDKASYPMTIYSGSDDPTKVRQIKTIFNLPYISYNSSWYDGYEGHSEYVNPFREKVMHTATDGKQYSAGLLSEDHIINYVAQVYKLSELKVTKEVSVHDFDLYEYRVLDECFAAEDQVPHNKIFYQTIKGFFNVSFTGSPLYVSRNHFYGADQKWANFIDIYDETGVNKQTANQWDDIYLHVEPHSGMLFDAYLPMCTSAFPPQDQLFHTQRMILPVFSIIRAGNISDYAVSELLGDLRMALGLKSKVMWAGLIGIIIIFVIFILIKIKRDKKSRDVKKQSLLDSIDTQFKDSKEKQEQEDEEEEEENVGKQENAEKEENNESNIADPFLKKQSLLQSNEQIDF